MKHDVAAGIAAALCGLLSSSCAPDRAGQIDEVVYSLGKLPLREPGTEAGDAGRSRQEGDYACTVQTFRETRQFDRIVAYSANSDSLWPGALVAGDSIYDGLFTQLSFDRAPLTFSISLENLAGSKSMRMESPSLSEFRESIGEVLSAEVTGATAADIYAEIEQVHSREQLALALGAEVSWLGGAVANVSASFDFSREEIHSRYLVRYVQSYYTADVDPPGRPNEIFADSLQPGVIERRLEGGGPPVYVSSITYGRMVLFTFESEYSAEELGAALEFAYRGGVDVSGDTSVTYRDVVERSEITAYILGGSGEVAARSIESFDALMEFIESGGDYSRESPGAPIAYRLSYLADNSPARLSLTSEYEVKDCRRVSQKVRVTLDSLRVEKGADGDSLELYGTAGASSRDSDALLFDRDLDHHVPVFEGETWPQNGPIGEAVLGVTPQEGETIRLHADLWDHDSSWFADDDSLGQVEIEVPFETGWRREVTMLLTGDGARVEATFSLTPI